jgi:menaquinol-cytochrome c reductase iron-sulfur subunit
MTTRRQLLSRALAGVGFGIASIVGIPSLIAAFSPVIVGRARERWRSVGSVDQFDVASVRRGTVRIYEGDWPRTVREKGVYVWRRSADEFVVFSRNCTDLSCPVTWDAGSEWFYCPCHGGIFSREGERMAGPPRRSLFRYTHRIRENVLEIDLSSLPPVT